MQFPAGFGYNILADSKAPTRQSPAKAARRAGGQPAKAGQSIESAPTARTVSI